MNEGRILNYHDVGGASSPYVRHLSGQVSVKAFESHLKFLKMNSQIVPFSQFHERSDEKGCVAITFDDGFLSIKDHVLPLIEKYECPVKIFLNLNSITNGTSWLTQLSYLYDTLSPREISEFAQAALGAVPCSRGKIPFGYFWYFFKWPRTWNVITALYKERHAAESPQIFLNSRQVEELVAHPLVEVGSHSRNHFPLHALPQEVLKDEVVAHHLDLTQRFGTAIQGFAVPFGFREHLTDDVMNCISEIDDNLLISPGGLSCLPLENSNLPEVVRVPVDSFEVLAHA